MNRANMDVERTSDGVVLGPVYSLKTGAIGGLIGGLCMAVVAMLTGVLMGQGIWYPLNLVGATLVRSLQSAPAAELMQFDLIVLVAGFIVHFISSIGLGVAIVAILPTLPGRPLVWSAVVGLALWAIAQFAVLPIINPLMAEGLNVPSFIIAHLAYSIAVGLYFEQQEPVNVNEDTPDRRT